MTSYYNENDPFAAAWLRELVRVGEIAPGWVDERDIRDVKPDELIGYSQHHFFAGIGVWSFALRRAGWRDSDPVWTGSCPCQPFSAAGKRGGAADERHLWPAWFHLISQRCPAIILGEQVANGDGLAWLDTVSADLEGADYACGAVDLCAAGVGAPHIRQRLWFVAHAAEPRRTRRLDQADWQETFKSHGQRPLGGLADTTRRGDTHQHKRHEPQDESWAPVEFGAVAGTGGRDGKWTSPARVAVGSPFGGGTDGSDAGGLADPGGGQLQEPLRQPHQRDGAGPDGANVAPGPTNGFWRDADWLQCRDGKWRPVEPGTFPLAHGIAGRVGQLRGYGNALNAEAAATFVAAYMDRNLRVSVFA